VVGLLKAGCFEVAVFASLSSYYLVWGFTSATSSMCSLPFISSLILFGTLKPFFFASTSVTLIPNPPEFNRSLKDSPTGSSDKSPLRPGYPAIDLGYEVTCSLVCYFFRVVVGFESPFFSSVGAFLTTGASPFFSSVGGFFTTDVDFVVGYFAESGIFSFGFS